MTSTLFVVVRVTLSRSVVTSKPRVSRAHGLADLARLQEARPETDYRLAALDVPSVAPFSDHWLADTRGGTARKAIDFIESYCRESIAGWFAAPQAVRAAREHFTNDKNEKR